VRYYTFGHFLREMRILRGYASQQAMLGALRLIDHPVSKNTFSMWETDEVMPSREHFQALLQVLKPDAEQLAEARRLFADAPCSDVPAADERAA
jgi:transcriptional regulator with XRE-family HTH domain